MISNIEFYEKTNELFPRFVRTFKTVNANEMLYIKNDLTIVQKIVLKILIKKPHYKMTELASLLNVTIGNVTGIIDKLVKKKYVKRYRSKQDRRVVFVELVAAGKKIVNFFEEAEKKHILNILSRITDQEKEQLFSIMMKIVTQMEHVQ
ncbi:MAG: hypothetical protein A2096_04355 [Spirochaetes bacterium GWF1_41_5]|nr:MAG: hypothetical protein A2096_04355 [Spirochaetes bacterium GWF1_41_5]HBE04272.1 hypothetical protein [Spirochaetia bacterium]